MLILITTNIYREISYDVYIIIAILIIVPVDLIFMNGKEMHRQGRFIDMQRFEHHLKQMNDLMAHWGMIASSLQFVVKRHDTRYTDRA
jgi:hypothetical protein